MSNKEIGKEIIVRLKGFKQRRWVEMALAPMLIEYYNISNEVAYCIYSYYIGYFILYVVGFILRRLEDNN